MKASDKLDKLQLLCSIFSLIVLMVANFIFVLGRLMVGVCRQRSKCHLQLVAVCLQDNLPCQQWMGIIITILHRLMPIHHMLHPHLVMAS